MASETGDVQQSVVSVDWLEHRLEAGRVRHNASMAVRVSAWALAVLILSLFIYGCLDFLVRFPGAVRLVATLALLAVFSLFALRSKRRFLRRIETTDDLARFVERIKVRQGQSQHALLVAAIEFGRRLNIPGSNALKNEAIRLAQERCVNPARVNLHDPLFTRRLLRICGLALAALLFSFGIVPRHTVVFASRLLGLDVRYPTATRLVELRYRPQAPVRMDYPIEVRIEGRLPPSGALRADTEGGSVFALPLEAVEGEVGLYRATLATPLESFSFSFRIGDYRSQRHEVALRPPPRAAGGTITVTPPAYTGRDAYTAAFGSVDAPEGSRLRFRVVPTVPVEECVLVAGETNIVMQSVGDGYECEMTADLSLPFYSRMKDVFGIENREEARHYLAVVRDTPPDADIIEPVADTFRSNLSRVRFGVTAKDDYALASVALRYTVYRSTSATSSANENEKVVSHGEIPFEGAADRTEFARRTMFQVSEFKARPGDRVAVAVVARERRDGDARETLSREVSVHVVTDEELRAIIERERYQLDRLVVKLRDDEKTHLETLRERLKP